MLKFKRARSASKITTPTQMGDGSGWIKKRGDGSGWQK